MYPNKCYIQRATSTFQRLYGTCSSLPILDIRQGSFKQVDKAYIDSITDDNWVMVQYSASILTNLYGGNSSFQIIKKIKKPKNNDVVMCYDENRFYHMLAFRNNLIPLSYTPSVFVKKEHKILGVFTFLSTQVMTESCIYL